MKVSQETSMLASPPSFHVSGSHDGNPTKELFPALFLMIETLNTGGGERQFSALAQSLRDNSFDVRLGCIRRLGSFLEGLGEVDQFRMGGSLYGWRSLRARWSLARQLQRRQISVAQSFDFYANMTLIPAALLARVPVVIGSQRQFGDLMTARQSLAQLAVFHCCDRVVCNSHAAASRLRRQGLPESKIVVIHNGVPAAAFAYAQPALPGNSGKVRVGMVARMNAQYKNHSAFLRAAAQLCRKFPEVEYVLAGDGPLRQHLEEETAKLGIRERVVFLGDHRDIPAVLAAIDISVLPSVSESLSNVILESMAASRPVVAMNVGGNSEAVTTETGILVDPANEDGLSRAIERLLGDRDLRSRMGAKGRQVAESQFSMERATRSYQSLYAELLERKKGKTLRSVPVPGKRRLRVALVAPSLAYVGGQSVQADLLLRKWRDDPEVEVQFVPVDPQFPRALSWAAKVPILRTAVRAPIYFFSLWRALKNVDITHAFSASYWSFLLAPTPALLISKLKGKKVMINYRSGEARDHLRRFRSGGAVLRLADRVAVPSGYLAEVFREFGISSQIVPNVVDNTGFTYRIRRPLRPHFLCNRGFHPYYCVDVVVKAFAQIKAAYPGATLDLVGGGKLEPVIRQLVADLNLSDVTFSGIASREQMAGHFEVADVFINASCLDNMPVSVLEAFASGTPVVTTAPESMRFLVQHERTGLLSEVGDPATLAQNAIRLLRDQDLAATIAANAHEESRRYAWPAVREQWIRLYSELAGTLPCASASDS
jgi:glycosyltransferase involved in cell wall biosynthesis